MNFQVKNNVNTLKKKYQYSCVSYMLQEEKMSKILFDGMGTKKNIVINEVDINSHIG